MKKITDVVTILGPAIIAAVGVFSATGAIEVEKGYQILLIVLGAVSSIASIIFNNVEKKLEEKAK